MYGPGSGVIGMGDNRFRRGIPDRTVNNSRDTWGNPSYVRNGIFIGR